MPISLDNHIVISLINIVLVDEILKGTSFKVSNRIVPASAAPSPPGRNDKAPITVAARWENVATVQVISVFPIILIIRKKL